MKSNELELSRAITAVKNAYKAIGAAETRLKEAWEACDPELRECVLMDHGLEGYDPAGEWGDLFDGLGC